jgi:hypothetical protein
MKWDVAWSAFGIVTVEAESADAAVEVAREELDYEIPGDIDGLDIDSVEKA